ncbi:MAG: complex I NDUFA9 subunit family protein [Gammaproteobacteria bacterium]|nr:complex I NDUFA9 subunit family protein [Gammaproteobacteria bacterium]
MQYNKICILGGSGFVGTHLISQLGAAGKSIKVLTRRKERSKHLSVLPDIEIVEANVHDQHVLNEQLKGMDAVINLVGILNEREHNGDGFRYAHVELPRKILNACHENKISRLLHMGALNADANSSPSRYLRSKGEGENQLHSFAGKINVTSFRPSVIYGPNDSFFNRFAGLLKLMPIFPLACADTRFAPVFVGDVARRFVDALDDPGTFGQRYDLCGPKEYTLKELVEYTGQSLGLKRTIIGQPDILSQIQAIMLEWVPGKPFSIDNFQSLQVDSVCKEGTPEPTTVESIVPYYLGRQQKTELKDQYRQLARR